jgi:hypothetical protein
MAVMDRNALSTKRFRNTWREKNPSKRNDPAPNISMNSAMVTARGNRRASTRKRA